MKLLSAQMEAVRDKMQFVNPTDELNEWESRAVVAAPMIMEVILPWHSF